MGSSCWLGLLFSLCLLLAPVHSAVLSVSFASQTDVLDSGSFSNSIENDYEEGNVFFGYSVPDAATLIYLNGTTVMVTFTDSDNQTSVEYEGSIQNSISLYFPPCRSDQVGTWWFSMVYANNTTPPPTDSQISVWGSAISSDIATTDSFPYMSNYFQFYIDTADAADLAFNFTTATDNLGSLITNVSLYEDCVPEPQADSDSAVASVDLDSSDPWTTLSASVESNSRYYLLFTGTGDLSELDKSISIFSSYVESPVDESSTGNSHTGLYIAISLGFGLCICLLVILVIAFFLVKKKQQSQQIGDFEINDDEYDDLF